jgi:hypothetical protein
VLISAHANYTRRQGQMKLCGVDKRIEEHLCHHEAVAGLRRVHDRRAGDRQLRRKSV